MSGETSRVLCIAGSPRRHGNSDRLLDAVERGVEEAGGHAVRLIATEAAVAPCRGCGACSRTGECVVDDGMHDVYRMLDSASAIVVATPVFFATVPAGLKAMYDRCQPYWARRHLLGEARPERYRPGAAIVVGGGGDPFGTGCALTPTRSVFAVLGVELTDSMEVVGPDAPRDIEHRPDDLAHATEIGRLMVTSAR